MPPTIDVLIVTTNASELIGSCLEHLRRQTVPHTVHIADNGSTDGTVALVREAFPEVHVVENGANLGFGKSLNKLAGLTSGEVIVLANDDMDVAPDFLERLVAPLADDHVGMVAGLTLQPGGAGVVDGFGIELDRALSASNRLRHRRPDEPAGVLAGPSGGAAAYRREAWERAAGFEPAFFVYCEDVDLALRLRLDGWQAAAAPDARGVHLGGATTGKGSDFQRRHAGFGRGFLLRRYGVLRTPGAPRALLVDGLVVLYGLVRFRTLVPLTARIAGWRAAAKGPGLELPTGAIDETITLRDALGRLRRP